MLKTVAAIANTGTGNNVLANSPTIATPTLTGDVQISTGNLVIGTSGKGIDFSATPGTAGATSELLNDYEEGTWTPTDGSGAGLTITFNNAKYTKIGRLVYISVDTIEYPVTASAANAVMASLPFTNLAGNVASSALVTSSASANRALVVASSTNVFFYANASASASTNLQLSGQVIYGFSAVYQTT
jgi:hypothetical protein